MRFRFLGGVCAAAVGVLLSVEVLIRQFGLLEFPLYSNSKELGYLLAPNQHGSYLNRNDWAFNDLSMGVAKLYDPSKSARNILLVGDSIVLGGNLIPQDQRLGPLLNRECPDVWPASAGSWALLNELRYLRIHDRLLSDINRVVLILNSGDFGSASVWSSELTHPTHRPISGLWYLTSKYFFHEDNTKSKSTDDDWATELRNMRSTYSGPLTIVLYPDRAEIQSDTLRKSNLEAYAPKLQSYRTTVLSLAENPHWSRDFYRDDIHPTIDGLKELSAFLKRNIPECNE
ncbi:hypothetical protein UP09_07175 [Bradyrhizobium sp. LTSP885]|uniref:hypothetical protein n=1 Tax=Bradyrhizobium sp. LTSP885 TaxID=1619232 RepID=UPI0005C875D8|nr:hypothetical protein [Bradyrhizobium sp. LTSP885]KJC49473.1 hypothetical protein UP09_07175 [Bradyrhizobium sp. LTSP885]